MLDFIARAKKAIAATVGTALAAYLTANEDGKVTEAEWIPIAGSLLVGVVVYVLRNRPQVNAGTVKTRSGPAPY